MPTIVMMFVKPLNNNTGVFQTQEYYYTMLLSRITAQYVSGNGFCNAGAIATSHGRKSADGKTVFWYNEQSAANQLNASNEIYGYLAIS